MVSKIDQRRLNDGAEAATLGEPETIEDIGGQIETISDGILALQSLDDLGSEEANDDAWNQMLELQEKRNVLKEKLRSLKQR